MTPSSSSADGRDGLSCPSASSAAAESTRISLQSRLAERGQEQARHASAPSVDRCTGTHLRRRGQLDQRSGLVARLRAASGRAHAREASAGWSANSESLGQLSQPLDRREAAVVVEASRRPLDQRRRTAPPGPPSRRRRPPARRLRAGAHSAARAAIAWATPGLARAGARRAAHLGARRGGGTSASGPRPTG